MTDLFHVFNRGVDKRAIVLDVQDRNRFVTDLFVMNDENRIENTWRYVHKDQTKGIDIMNDVGRRSYLLKRKPLVQIHGWCLMENHYHLLVSEEIEGGLSIFLKKLNMGYAKYFNEKYKRSGALFQGKTKKKYIDNDAYFLWILNYIHFNPLDYMDGAKNWRMQCLKEPEKALEWLSSYPWSSYQDYIGESTFEPIVEGSFMYKDKEEYVSETEDYLKSISDQELSPFYLE